MVRKKAFERTGLSRAAIDTALTLTPEEFRVEQDLIAIRPIFSDDGLTALIAALEEAGLVHVDDSFELSGNWPDWVTLYATARQT